MIALLAAAFGLLLPAETYRTEIVFLEVMEVGQAAALYERVLGTPGEASVSAGRTPNMLVIHDRPRRVAAFRELLGWLDRAPREHRIYVRPVVHRSASELAGLVDETFPSGEVVTVADDRSSQLIVRTAAETYSKVDALLRRLDRPATDPRTIRVTPGPQDGEFPP